MPALQNGPKLRLGTEILVLLATALAAAVFYPRFSLNHDASWYLTGTGMFLDGGRLYHDIVEINPPLAFYLTIPPVWIARAVDGDPTTAYFLYVIALALVASVWSLLLLEAADLPPSRRAMLVAAVAVVLFVLPIAEFGQREHLLLIFAMPFLIGQVLRPALPGLGLMHQVALALAASLGLLLKPYFLIIPACIVIVRLFQERTLRAAFDPGMLALAGASILYVAFIVLIHPAYFNVIVPVARVVYAAYGMGAADVLLKFEIFAAMLVVMAGLRSNRGVHGQISQLFLSASIGSAAVYLVQFKGWNYHILPLSAWLILASTWLAARSDQQAGHRMFEAKIIPLAALMIVGLQIGRGPYQSATTAVFAPFVKTRHERVLVLSTNVWAAFPFVNEVSKGWASRYPAQWLIPGAYDCLMEKSASMPAKGCKDELIILREARKTVIDDFIKYKPDIVFIDERDIKSYFRSGRFDYLNFLDQDPKFEFFSTCYRRITTVPNYGVFERICTVQH
jgi:hypothetical protein